ncbi:MAG: hypothetical protein IJN74_02165 [Clostridia bacterium]|nr:hypothetical protein [Clostridia bacterium]
MQNSVKKWQTAGFIFTSVLGVILHFLFEWSGQNPIIASFSAVNESIWEHMKILFFPMALFALLESRYVQKAHKDFWCAKLTGIILGIVLIPALYYTVLGMFGKSPDFINIAIFFVVAAIVYTVETALLGAENTDCRAPRLARLLIPALAVLFMVFTFYTPQIPLFRDPISGTYGYQHAAK